MHNGLTTRVLQGAAALAVASTLAACTTAQSQANDMESNAAKNIAAQREKAAQPIPVVTSSPSAWLMGQSVEVVPTQSPLLEQMVTYHPTQRVTLTDVANWVSQLTGVRVDSSEAQAPAGATSSVVQLGAMPMAAQASQAPSQQTLAINYEGPLAGLLDAAANKAGVWWKFDSGRISFYRTETKTFFLPAMARKSTGSSAISSLSSSGGSGGASSSGGQSGGSSASGGDSGSSGGGGGGGGGGGASSTSSYAVDMWGDLEKAAKIVGGSALVFGNSSMNSITVSGTPGQVRNVQEWAKSLADNLSQQVAITVQIYKVKKTKSDNYGWSPDVIFSGLKTKYGFGLTGPGVPAVTSGTLLNLTASVLPGATGSQAQYTGSQLAVQALSQLGEVSETMQTTVVTLNGQPAPLQLATQTSYLAQSTQSPSTTVGTAPSTTLTPGQVTTGFTAMFLPTIVNGKILFSLNLTNSSLLSMGSVSSGGSSIQTPNVDVATFQQNVSLTPGESLLLTGIQQDNGKVDKSGVGVANNYLFGGGAGSNADKQLIAIVITAKVL